MDVDVIGRLLYGPNVAAAVLAGAGVLTMFLALFATAPSPDVARKVMGREREATSLQLMIEQANLPVTVGEFIRTGLVVSLATGVLGFVVLRTVTGVLLGLAIGPLGYVGLLMSKRDKTRREYQEALARVATIYRDVLGRGGGLKEATAAVAERGPHAVKRDFEEAIRMVAASVDVDDALEALGRRRCDPILSMLIEILLVFKQHGSAVKQVLERLAQSARRKANTRKRILAEQAQTRRTAQIVAIAPFITLAIARFSMPGLIAPFYATTVGEITMLVAGLISVVSYTLVMRIGNRPLQVVESVFVEAEVDADEGGAEAQGTGSAWSYPAAEPAGGTPHQASPAESGNRQEV
jgi:tight adherence protein B